MFQAAGKPCRGTTVVGRWRRGKGAHRERAAQRLPGAGKAHARSDSANDRTPATE